MIQWLIKNIKHSGNIKLKTKLPKRPSGIEIRDTLLPRKSARINCVENKPKINITFE